VSTAEDEDRLDALWAYVKKHQSRANTLSSSVFKSGCDRYFITIGSQVSVAPNNFDELSYEVISCYSHGIQALGMNGVYDIYLVRAWESEGELVYDESHQGEIHCKDGEVVLKGVR
jgi:hypothetical protein